MGDVSWYCNGCKETQTCNISSTDIVNSTATNVSMVPTLNADISNIPVLEDSTAAPFQPDIHDGPPVLQKSCLDLPNIYDEPPILHKICLDIPTPAQMHDHDAVNTDLSSLTRRSGEHITYEVMEIVSADEQSTMSPPDPSLLEEPEIRNFIAPDDSEEDSLLEEAPVNASELSIDSVIELEVIENGIEKGNLKLVNSNGYSYAISRVRNGTSYWVCPVRNKVIKCKASVTQRSGSLSVSDPDHCHPPVAGEKAMLKMKAQFKERAQEQPCTATSAIVEETLDTHITPGEPCDLPNPRSLYKTANRVRQASRPNHPENFKFDLKLEATPDDFVQADISVKGNRHLLRAGKIFENPLVL